TASRRPSSNPIQGQPARREQNDSELTKLGHPMPIIVTVRSASQLVIHEDPPKHADLSSPCQVACVVRPGMRVAPSDGWRARTIKWVTTALALVAGMALRVTQRAAIGGTPILAPDPCI